MTPTPDSITEAQGIFAAPSGNDNNPGTRAQPFATLTAAIASASKVGKVVFACTGKYAEAITVVDSISIIGGLDCTDPTSWKTGAAPSDLASPTSPAIIAKSISSPTRIEGFAVVAPNATTAGGSSFGVLATSAPALTIASSTITAGDGAPGTNGVEANKLVDTGRVDGDPSTAAAACPSPGTGAFMHSTVCYSIATRAAVNASVGAGGVSACGGTAAQNGGAGGNGGGGGLWEAMPGGQFANYWQNYSGLVGGRPGAGGTGPAAMDGGDGPPAAAFGTFTSDGYVSPNGNAGSDGTPGQGGQGGTGGTLGTSTPTAAQASANELDSGPGGAGGGAGGCPGLAGTPGTGGGASIGIGLVESPIILDSVAVRAGTGGSGGHGTFGSDPSAGGNAGTNATGQAGASAGGRGGRPGISTNGANGPSIGILVSGAAPMLTGTSKATPGTGGTAIAAGEHPDPVAGTRTIPATPAGLAVDIKTL